MKIGYMFPVAIIVAAVALLAWFIIGGYAMPGSTS
ncbi:YoaK family small membrane protein [Serratia marcescens]|nr:YoaK family small membrane protein [Serratia marcescens]ELN4405969.1 YoaK family small membrane protein [Serratia marcescens]HBC0576093.1 YoaK family small membrane protein [Serratia marcescens]HBV3812573.1 YoaK family small membrane protein [Serratia marcescens]